jgi:uncharacterized protein with PQ loop repeat
MITSQELGYLGSFLLITCALPQLFKTIKTKNVEGLSLWTTIMCGSGCFLVLNYILHTNKDSLLVFNYAFNGLVYFILTLLYIKYKK